MKFWPVFSILLSCGGNETHQKESCLPGTSINSADYTKLSDTGLFGPDQNLSCNLIQYEPNFPLYSDGAEKKRFLSLPINQTIDTTDPNHWSFPIGTKFWKEFSVDGKRIETRLIERIDASQYFMGSFVWNEDQDDALLTLNGEENALETIHDIPSWSQCHYCHDGEPGKILGFSSVQLSGKTTAFQNLFSSGQSDFVVPGNKIEKEALGYLHANCSHCHNDMGSCAESGLFFRLNVGDVSAEETLAFKTSVNQEAIYAKDGGEAVPATVRVVPGDPSSSAVVQRMTAQRSYRMPWLGVKIVDRAGVEKVSAWIENLPH